MAYQPRPPSRRPRPEEMRLLRSLISGPRAVASGPLGRCLKRGWCESISPPIDAQATRQTAVWTPPLFALTAAGHAVIASSHVDAGDGFLLLASPLIAGHTPQTTTKETSDG
jgi:hypothetical protein